MGLWLDCLAGAVSRGFSLEPIVDMTSMSMDIGERSTWGAGGSDLRRELRVLWTHRWLIVSTGDGPVRGTRRRLHVPLDPDLHRDRDRVHQTHRCESGGCG